MEDNELQPIIEQLEKLQFDKPALVVMTPDYGKYLEDNRGGLVNLAIASLRAASGQAQSLKDNTWLVAEDYDFDLAGIQLDEAAHIYLPPVLTKWQTFKKNFWGAVVGIAVVAMLLIGFVVTVSFVIGLFRSH